MPIARHVTSVAVGLTGAHAAVARGADARRAVVCGAGAVERVARAGDPPSPCRRRFATWAVGRVSADERARRRLLRRVVGIGAPPELLVGELPGRVRGALEAAWREVSTEAWPSAIVDGVANELLVALAEYHGRYALAAQARANLARRPSARA